ncbi:MAG: DUF1992 domain-containing protein [Rhodobacter sp.]|nr:DUF1992 domain-containing protein [Rhodobacter sp.]
MFGKLRQLTEAQIRKAADEGQLSGLSGEGKPLPNRSADAFIDPSDAIGHRIMAEAGALPEEICLKRQADAARASMAAITDPKERKAAMAELAELEMKHAIAQEARRKFLKA